MYQLCEAMKWNHLPVAGGIYDQDPDLLDGFIIIFRAKAEHDEAEAKKRQRGMRQPSKVAGGRRR